MLVNPNINDQSKTVFVNLFIRKMFIYIDGVDIFHLFIFLTGTLLLIIYVYKSWLFI